MVEFPCTGLYTGLWKDLGNILIEKRPVYIYYD